MAPGWFQHESLTASVTNIPITQIYQKEHKPHQKPVLRYSFAKPLENFYIKQIISLQEYEAAVVIQRVERDNLPSGKVV